MLKSYPSIFQLGHRGVELLKDAEVHVEEKIDGSQLSFGVVAGFLCARSKGAIVNTIVPDALFRPAIETAFKLFEEGLLREGYVYRGEAVCKPRHNTISYARVPDGGFILFDIERGEQDFLSYVDKLNEARRLGLECVPLLAQGKVPVDTLKALLETESCLGGSKIEGVVIKPLHRDLFGADKKLVIAKLVREDFKEENSKNWKRTDKKSILDSIIDTYRNENRWRKVIQHMRDDGKLEGSPRDIGKLLIEIQADIKKECEEEIKELLFKVLWREAISRGVVRGFPEFYKGYLLEEGNEID